MFTDLYYLFPQRTKKLTSNTPPSLGAHHENTAISELNTASHPVVSKDRWIAERKKLLGREKDLTYLSDQIASERRALPWVHIDKNYVFDTLDGLPAR